MDKRSTDLARQSCHRFVILDADLILDLQTIGGIARQLLGQLLAVKRANDTPQNNLAASQIQLK
jgi:hypothetical protein